MPLSPFSLSANDSLDAIVQKIYAEETRLASQEILEAVEKNSISVEEGSKLAHAERNRQLEEMRKRTSPLGRFVVRMLKKRGPEYYKILDWTAQRNFGTGFKDLTQEHKKAVHQLVITSAGNANAKVNKTAFNRIEI